jgi:predicted metal-dependent phosphotriesterase family hydrolase
MNLKKIKKIKTVLTLSIILATGIRKYFKYREKKMKDKDQKEDK